MYAIIDIETTGLNARTERITEIAIYIHDGQKIIDEFSSLINPEKKIPFQITALTGINNKMVNNAPRFCEIAKTIVEITQNKTIVGHNVNFDYGFIRHEFKRLGYEYQRKTLCTCKLSKKAFPHQKSYGLGRLCKALHIENPARHRASGDALATTRLFEMIRAVDRELTNKPLKSLNINIDKSLVDNLPGETGVYYFYNQKGQIIYIGKSTNIKSRVHSHLSNNLSKRAIEMREEIADIGFEVTGNELIALLLESDEIKKHTPVYNRAQRKSRFNWGLYSYKDDKGYIRLKLIQILDQVSPITSYASKTEGREHLFKLVEEFQLCQKLCGLYDHRGPCFQHQIRQCQGACTGKELPESYNQRLQRALSQYLLPHQSFFVIDQGRHADEISLVKIEKGKYCGFGFADRNGQEPQIDILNHSIKSFTDNKDVQQILRSYLRRHQVENIITF